MRRTLLPRNAPQLEKWNWSGSYFYTFMRLDVKRGGNGARVRAVAQLVKVLAAERDKKKG